MQSKNIGFIGGGRITRIFLEGWTRAQKLPANITVSDLNADTLAKLKAQFPSIVTTPDNARAAAQDIVFLAVHPPAMTEIAAAIKSAIKPDAVVVSLAPKFTITKLGGLLGGFARLTRVIPNAPSVVNFGFNPVAFGPALTETDKAAINGLLAPLGDCPEVAEEKLEAYAMLTARGPVYFWFQFYELRQLAESFGLSREEAQTGLETMLAGAFRTMSASGLSADDVKNLVPLKPSADMERQITDWYRTWLTGDFQRIKP